MRCESRTIPRTASPATSGRESQTTAHYVSHRLQTAMIWINAGFERDLRQPFGGIKSSGTGREGGEHSREFYTETRFASFPLTPRAARR